MCMCLCSEGGSCRVCDPDNWVRVKSVWCKKKQPKLPGTMNILSACVGNIMDNVKTFGLICPDCDHRVTDRLEPTPACCHKNNKIGTCEWVFCPLNEE